MSVVMKHQFLIPSPIEPARFCSCKIAINIANIYHRDQPQAPQMRLVRAKDKAVEQNVKFPVPA